MRVMPIGASICRVNNIAIAAVLMRGAKPFLDRMEYLQGPLEAESQQERQQQNSYFLDRVTTKHESSKSIRKSDIRKYFLLPWRFRWGGLGSCNISEICAETEKAR